MRDRRLLHRLSGLHFQPLYRVRGHREDGRERRQGAGPAEAAAQGRETVVGQKLVEIQRVHLPELLVHALRSRNLEPKDFEFYVNAFKTGAPPHAGWSIGLERLTMKMCGLDPKTIAARTVKK